MNPLSKKKLQALGLVNSRAIAVAAKNRIYVEHHKSESVIPSRWVVQGINFKTDPKAAWYNYGCMIFIGKAKDDNVRQMAITWASTEYLTGETSWERDAFGGWHPYGTIARAVAAKEDT